jgi:hypothetical protein
MPEHQKNIYYLTGESLSQVRDSPFLEVFKIVRLLELEALLRDADELLVLKLLELRRRVLVDRAQGLHHAHARAPEEHLLSHRRVALAGPRLSLPRGLGRVEAEELGELGAVLRVLVDAELEVLAERLVEQEHLLSHRRVALAGPRLSLPRGLQEEEL